MVAPLHARIERDLHRGQLSEETRRVLREHRPLQPMFPNAMVAELFAAKYTRGPFRVLPRTDGRYVVFDTRRPWNDRVVDVECSADDALEAANRRADAEGIVYDEEATPWTP